MLYLPTFTIKSKLFMYKQIYHSYMDGMGYNVSLYRFFLAGYTMLIQLDHVKPSAHVLLRLWFLRGFLG